jgi:acetylornithine deacetylase/succinyl-diaminopimelate desuccinylase-like protein
MAIELLRDLVRFDTTNPPGNELPAAMYLANRLQSEGLEPTVLEAAPGRGSVVARLRGAGTSGALLLMSHLDVVPAQPEEWDHPPFAAEIADGCIWGRGTVDTKQLTAMQAAVLITLHRQNVPLSRDIVFIATADEETGGRFGMQWLVGTHGHLLDCEYAINEGGGYGLQLGGRRVYLCQTGEKGVCWMRLTARGRPGHGSIPVEENAVAKLSSALASVTQARLPQHRTSTVQQMVRGVAASQPLPTSLLLPLILHPWLEPVLLEHVAERSELAPALRAALHNTISPTVLRAGESTNVIPSSATAEVDGRLIPGQQVDDLIREIRPYIGDEIEVEVIGRSVPYESDPDSPLFDLFRQVLQEHDPGCTLVPFLVPGATDGQFLAQRGVKVYGFSPARQEPNCPTLELAHAKNERVSLANMEFGTRVLYDVVRRFCTS